MAEMSVKERQAESARRKRIISFPPSDLACLFAHDRFGKPVSTFSGSCAGGSVADAMPAGRMASIEGSSKTQKRKFAPSCFRQNGMRCGLRLHRNIVRGISLHRIERNELHR
jgi:hypothetical protein